MNTSRREMIFGASAIGLIGCATSRTVELSDGSTFERASGVRVRFLGSGSSGWQPAWAEKNPHMRRQSSILVENRVLIDFTACGFDKLPKGCRPEAVFITHSHGDHYDPNAIVRVGVRRVYVQTSWAKAARDQIAQAAEELGMSAPDVLALPFGYPVTVCGLRFTAVPATHSTSRVTDGELERASMYLIEKGTTRLLYATDTSGIPNDAARMIGIDPIVTEARYSKFFNGNPMVHTPAAINALIMEATCGDKDTHRIRFAHSSVPTVARIVEVLTAAGRFTPPTGQYAYITHLGARYRGWPSERIDKELPDTLRSAYDGLEVVFG